jgi:hypothetical protein
MTAGRGLMVKAPRRWAQHRPSCSLWLRKLLMPPMARRYGLWSIGKRLASTSLSRMVSI